MTNRKSLTRNSFKKLDGVELAIMAQSPAYMGIYCARTGRLVAQVGVDDLFDGERNRFDLSRLGERD